MNQINEALAELREGQKKAAIYRVPFLVTIQEAAQEHRKCVRDWITCPTCKGRELDIPLPVELTEPCPDCVDGMIPSPELIMRVARHLHPGKWWDEPELWPSAVALYLDEAKAVLLASRREGEA